LQRSELWILGVDVIDLTHLDEVGSVVVMVMTGGNFLDAGVKECCNSDQLSKLHIYLLYNI